MKNIFFKKSLKPIKKKLQNKNKIFFIIRYAYPHLNEFSNKEILNYYNVTSLNALKTHIEHIKKILKEQTIQDEEKLKELSTCFCIDSYGEFKYLYALKTEAQKQTLFLLKTKAIKLKLYACPFHCGWHLSKI